MAQQTYIYTLLLKDGFYYVGSSKNVQKRFQQHLEGSGPEWTRLHRPIMVDKWEPCTPGKTPGVKEELRVKEMMLQHGIEKVRGGPYSNRVLTEQQRNELIRSIRHANNQCLRCGRASHFADQCYAKTDAQGRPISKSSCSGQNVQYATADSNGTTINGRICTRCGRSNHIAENCYASRDVLGASLSADDSDGFMDLS